MAVGRTQCEDAHYLDHRDGLGILLPLHRQGSLAHGEVIEVASALELKCVQATHPGLLRLELLSVRTNLLAFVNLVFFGCFFYFFYFLIF